MVSVRRVAPVLLLVAAMPLLAAPKSSSRPPRDLHRVGDHWTAYNPPDPATYPAAAKTYAIKGGDTLWALAKQFYGNSYLWPQLWESNTWITDAHWIYPGDVLLVEGEATAGQTAAGEPALTRTETPGTEDTGAVATMGAAGSTPIPLATEADLYCYGYIGDPAEPMPNRVESFEDVEVMYLPNTMLESSDSVSTGDLVYVSGGTATGLVAGETYLLVEPGETITHPRTKAVLGRHWDFRGQIRILCTDERQSRAIITQACKEVHLGARLKPMPQLPIPIARIPDIPGFCDEASGRTAGYIVSSQGWELGLGVGNLVQLDLGRDDQLQPGDFLTVWRESPIAGQPRQVLGEVAVLTTEQRTSTAKVVAMRRTMEIGDHVEIR